MKLRRVTLQAVWQSGFHCGKRGDAAEVWKMLKKTIVLRRLLLLASPARLQFSTNGDTN